MMNNNFGLYSFFFVYTLCFVYRFRDYELGGLQVTLHGIYLLIKLI